MNDGKGSDFENIINVVEMYEEKQQEVLRKEQFPESLTWNHRQFTFLGICCAVR